MKDRYHLYMNGKMYGSGPLQYMHELIHDYIMVKGLYGADEVNFRILTAEKSRAEFNQKSKWAIVGESIRPCRNCGKETHYVSIAFEAPMCSEECDDEKYKEYTEDMKRMIIKEFTKDE